MKKILFMIPLLALLFTACDPTSEDNGPGANISAEELTNNFSISQESEGNNNLTFNLAHARYVKIYNADTGGLVAQGTNSLKAQVIPPTTTANFYAEAINPDGSKVKSTTKSVTVSNYTNLPAIFDQVFGKDANGNYQTSTWTWDDSSDKCWGNGGWGSDQGPSWWLLVVAVTNSPKHDFNRCKSATCRFLFRDTKSARDKNGTKPRKNKVKDTSPEISLVEYLCFVCKGTNLSLEKRGEIPISLIHNSFSYYCTPNVVIANGFDLKQHDLRKSGVKFCFAL